MTLVKYAAASAGADRTSRRVAGRPSRSCSGRTLGPARRRRPTVISLWQSEASVFLVLARRLRVSRATMNQWPCVELPFSRGVRQCFTGGAGGAGGALAGSARRSLASQRALRVGGAVLSVLGLFLGSLGKKWKIMCFRCFILFSLYIALNCARVFSFGRFCIISFLSSVVVLVFCVCARRDSRWLRLCAKCESHVFRLF